MKEQPNIGPMELVTLEDLEKIKAKIALEQTPEKIAEREASKQEFDRKRKKEEAKFPSLDELEQILRQIYPDLDEPDFRLLFSEQNKRMQRAIRHAVW